MIRDKNISLTVISSTIDPFVFTTSAVVQRKYFLESDFNTNCLHFQRKQLVHNKLQRAHSTHKYINETTNNTSTLNVDIIRMSTPELLTGLGAAAAIFLSSLGSCIASAPAGIFALRAEIDSDSMLSFGPIMIAGVLAMYGLIISIILISKLMVDEPITKKDGYKALSAGLVVGLSCLASGYGMSRFIEQSMTMDFTQFTFRYFLCLVYIEAIGLYGLIVALMLGH
jgi:V-type H+-transporting ATPase 16kDa proteolipid subunit